MKDFPANQVSLEGGMRLAGAYVAPLRKPDFGGSKYLVKYPLVICYIAIEHGP